MKPSDIIWGIFMKKKGWDSNRNDINDLEDKVQAIIDYLDGDYERPKG